MKDPESSWGRAPCHAGLHWGRQQQEGQGQATAGGPAGAGDGGMEGRQGPVTAGGRAAEGRRLDGGRPCARARDLVGLKLGELTALGRKKHERGNKRMGARQ